ncbi:MAG TPA: TetR/AcrR family transcriptional regulator, partial [Candidatus Choladocola avistercoris]|nr:TetR/AcrR family transcriptional regulator [Candidatus Choladocola avistercoris]
MTKECLYTALLLLMEKKPYEDITITEIAKKAGVSRMSYYRLYKSKDDILEQY